MSGKSPSARSANLAPQTAVTDGASEEACYVVILDEARVLPLEENIDQPLQSPVAVTGNREQSLSGMRTISPTEVRHTQRTSISSDVQRSKYYTLSSDEGQAMREQRRRW
ncbi:hypothetical protein M758_UG070000 [Ceratodon purpureus]|nr:hypothetical protein M758_UG070000 [Ceratodon purpureus]